MNAWLDKVTIKLPYHTRGAFIEALFIVGSPPIAQAAQRVKLRALIIKAVG